VRFFSVCSLVSFIADEGNQADLRRTSPTMTTISESAMRNHRHHTSRGVKPSSKERIYMGKHEGKVQ